MFVKRSQLKTGVTGGGANSPNPAPGWDRMRGLVYPGQHLGWDRTGDVSACMYYVDAKVVSILQSK